MLVFRGARAKEDDAPRGTISAFNPDHVYTNKEVFVVRLQLIISAVHSIKKARILLLLVVHITHTNKAESLDLARERGTIMLALCGLTKHRLQPLDPGLSFFITLSSHYVDAVEKRLRVHPRRCVARPRVAAIFGKDTNVGSKTIRLHVNAIPFRDISTYTV
jgi:hypothetical protein